MTKKYIKTFQKLSKPRRQPHNWFLAWSPILQRKVQTDWLIAIDLSKQEALNAGSKVTQRTNFTGNLNHAANTTMFFIIKKVTENILDFLQGTAKVL